MIKYNDYSDLIELLELEYKPARRPSQLRDYFLSLCSMHPDDNLIRDSVISKTRDWLLKFVHNPRNTGAVVNYAKVWEAISEVTDDHSFLKLMAANVHLMWD